MTQTLTHKQRTHARIIDEAAAAMRLHGTDGISVANLMKRAGLTHGGFYAHFSTRDDLVADAIDRMFQDSRSMLDDNLCGRDVSGGVAALIDAYLSRSVRRAPERRCPLPGLTGEAPRMPPAARARLNVGADNFRRTLATAFEALGRPDPEALASSVLAEMIGAMSLARAASDEAVAEAILSASRAHLKDRLGVG